MELLLGQDRNYIDHSGTISGCDTCALGKRQHEEDSGNTTHKTGEGMGLVETDLP